MRLVREDAIQRVEYEWGYRVQREFRFSEDQIKALEDGKKLKTPLRGGTKWFLVKEGSGDVQVTCPTCGGTGHLDRHIIYGIVGREESDKSGRKRA